MSRIKGQRTTSDYLPYKEFQRLLSRLHTDKLYQWEAYCRISFCTAFRVSDVRDTKWIDILNKDVYVKEEKKTRKTRQVKINDEIRESISQMYRLLGHPAPGLSVICNPRTGLPYSREHINYMLKIFKRQYRVKIGNFSSHSFRKTFGRYLFEKWGSNMEALFNIQRALNHRDVQTTIIYLGYTQEDVDALYQSLSFQD